MYFRGRLNFSDFFPFADVPFRGQTNEIAFILRRAVSYLKAIVLLTLISPDEHSFLLSVVGLDPE